MPRRLVLIAATAAAAAATAAPALAQYPDARTIPRGALRFGFAPEYLNWNQRFGVNGEIEPWGMDLTADSAGVQILPSLSWPERSVGSIVGDSSYRMTFGAITTTLDADVRKLAFNFQLGVTDRLTIAVSVPFVTSRIQADVVIDSTDANVGLNRGSFLAGDPAAAVAIQTLLAELDAAVGFIEGQITAGAYGCPTSAQCDQARDLVTRARELASNLGSLTGFTSSGPVEGGVVPFTPLQSSAEGQAILQAIQSLVTELQTLGAVPPSATLPLPTERAGVETFQSVLTAQEFGYSASAGIEFIKYRQKFGDAEVGLRWGAIQRPSLRAMLIGTVRLPTGRRDEPDHFIDLSTGDRQTDLEGGLEAVWAPGNALALAVSASYNAQLGDRLTRRITTPDRPIAPLSSRYAVQRNLGDVLRFAVYPSVRLTEGFTAYGSASYFRKGQDSYVLNLICLLPPCPPSETLLEQETAMRSWSFGAGIHYHNEGRGGSALPIQAGIDYRAAFSGSGGMTPKDVRLHFYLRLYKRVFGG
ncbi:MAG: hypothetical protein ACE5PT_11090 [Gemmatimonadales bacterium]